ncbi:MAG: alpha-ketoglutarate-dependent dioxygenase AlkB [Burkholderiales bacterium]|nr:alpha-ketoglutarate-dependent dioxygenase AlkB [Burkholderiales bacterium]
MFDDTAELEQFKIEGADVSFAPSIHLGRNRDDLLRELIVDTPWRHESVTIWGKRHLQPRLIAWYGDPGRHYSYSGISLDPLPWTPTLTELRLLVERLAGEVFNSVLLNYYRDHRDSMGFHSDDERELGPMPIIASLSFGATRTFVLKHKTRRDLKTVRFDLPSGSLIVMKGKTQEFWRHGIDKQTQPCGPRVNLTFRRIIF